MRGTAVKAKRGRMAQHTPALALPERCTCCLRTIDWSAGPRTTAPGLIEEGVVLCNSCAWQAAATAIAGSAVEAT